MIKKSIFLTVILACSFTLFIACGDSTIKGKSSNSFEDCPYGTPEAIFKPELPKVTSHSFQANSQSTLEKVAFEDGVVLEFIQSGCEKPIQEFQFTLPEGTKGFTDTDWINRAVEAFSFMGSLSPDLQPFLLLNATLKEKQSQLKLGASHQLEPGFSIKIDKVADAQTGLLLITLFKE